MNYTLRGLLVVGSFMGLACAPQPPEPSLESPTSAGSADVPVVLEQLGGHHHPITTSSPEAQRYFDQGLILTFGFNHDAALRAFAEAERLDPGCAMCAWGQAYALGPNINAPMGPDAARDAHAAAERARLLSAKATDRENAYIEAVSKRYAAEPPEDRAALDHAFAMAMRELSAQYPGDVDASVLTAEALMDLSPWNYWSADALPGEWTNEIVARLEAALEADPGHVGANHYYIHAVEEHFPEQAVPAAERLGSLAPDAGHLVHMPSHIFWRVGRYADAADINVRASAADERFFATCRAGAFYRALYYPHNVHFLWAAASTEGQSALAITTARKLYAQTSGYLDQFEFMQEFMTVPILTLVRFGRFDQVLGEPAPGEDTPYLLGIWHYARGLAFVRNGDLAQAEAELAAVRAIAESEGAPVLILSGGVANAAQLLRIGEAHLVGELALARGDGDVAIEALEGAVLLQDELAYMEPPPWYFPTRQALGAALLGQGQAEAAEGVYRKDLEQYPRNGWSLFGLAQALRAQGREAEAGWAEVGHRQAFARADVTLESSTFSDLRRRSPLRSPGGVRRSIPNTLRSRSGRTRHREGDPPVPSQAHDNLVAMLRAGGGVGTLENGKLDVVALRQGMESMTALAPRPEGVQYEPVDAAGVPAEWVTPESADPSKVLLYLHGGGYVIGSIATHRGLAGRLAQQAGTRALLIDYRLAPEHPFPAAVDDATAAYGFLLAQGVAPEAIALGGDSAGGGLTFATLVALKEAGTPLPAVAIALSPWVDLEGIGESMTTKADADPMIQRDGLRMMGQLYLGRADPRSPLAAPLYADLSGLPPTLVQVGTAETLLDDSTRIVERARTAGVSIEMEAFEDLVHVFQAFAPGVPESVEAVEKLGAFVKRHL